MTGYRIAPASHTASPGQQGERDQQGVALAQAFDPARRPAWPAGGYGRKVATAATAVA
jgi:hypothetical protein